MKSSQSVLVCQHTNCLSRGAAEVLAAFLSEPIPGFDVMASECLGQCNMGPNVRVSPEEVWYCRLKASDVPTIVEQHFRQGQPVAHLLHPRFHAFSLPPSL